MFNKHHKLLFVFSVMIIAFLLMPLIIALITSFSKSDTIDLPVTKFSFRWYFNILKQDDFISGFKTSAFYAFLSCIAELIVGIPGVYGMTRYHVNHKRWFQMIFLSPTFIPTIVTGFALYGFVVMTLHISSPIALFIGYFTLGLPFVIRFVTVGMEQINPDVEKAAWICGSSRFVSFMRIVLPSLIPFVFSAFILGFMNSFNSLTISLFLTGPGMSTLPSSLFNYVQQNDDPTVSAISVVMMLITIIIMFIIDRVMGINGIINERK